MKLKGITKRLMVCWRVLTTHSYFTFFCTKNQLHKTSYANELPWGVYKAIRDKAIRDTMLSDGVFNFTYDDLAHKITDDFLKKLGFEEEVEYCWNSERRMLVKSIGENRLEVEHYGEHPHTDKKVIIRLENKDHITPIASGFIGTVDDLCAFFDFAGIDFEFTDPYDNHRH